MNAAPAALGVLMLETGFARIPGDIGNPATFDFPVRYAVVDGASARRVVGAADPRLLAPFVAAAHDLVRDGVAALSTSCGFLVCFQRELEDAVAVPVWSSSLLLVAEVQAGLPPGRRVGVVTVDARALGASHLAAAGAPADTPVEGLEPGCVFQRCLLGDGADLDVESACAATVAASKRLVARCPAVGAIVLECTNMPPYADAVRRATGLPVHDITTLLAERFPPRHARPKP